MGTAGFNSRYVSFAPRDRFTDEITYFGCKFSIHNAGMSHKDGVAECLLSDIDRDLK
jgi:hypothetical protein